MTSQPTNVPLLLMRNLCLEFQTQNGPVRVVDDLDLTIAERETVCLVGESGSGKSVTALSIARLLPTPPARYVSGEIELEGRNVLTMSKRELRQIRGAGVGYIFQEPGAALNPVMRIGRQIRESLALHRPEAATREEVAGWLRRVGIPAPEARALSYPHQLSGGTQQRVMIAMALCSHPRLLIADEPTTALDVTIQAQILDLLAELKRQLGMSILLITHNLGIVGQWADRVAVMYAGQIVESGPRESVLQRPHHPYTRALIRAVPQLGAGRRRLSAIAGTVPQPGAFPSGCRFHPRCPIAQPDCRTHEPRLDELESGRRVRCPYWHSVDFPVEEEK